MPTATLIRMTLPPLKRRSRSSARRVWRFPPSSGLPRESVGRRSADHSAEAAGCQVKALDLEATSERSARLIEQLALAVEELEADATEDELAAEQAGAKTTTVRGFTRKRAERQTLP